MTVKLTGAGLRKIIREEIERMGEAVVPGGGVSTGQIRPEPQRLADLIKKNPEAMGMIKDLRDELGLGSRSTAEEALEALLDTTHPHLAGGVREGYMDDPKVKAGDIDPYGHRGAAERDIKSQEKWVKRLVALGMSGTAAFLVYNIAAAAGLLAHNPTPSEISSAVTLALSTMPAAALGGAVQMHADERRRKLGMGRK